jgi:hypothetical protein
VSSPTPSPEDGNRSSFQNVMFFGIQDDGKSPEKFCEFCTPKLDSDLKVETYNCTIK